MQIVTRTTSPSTAGADLLVLGCFGEPFGKTPMFLQLDRALSGELRQQVRDHAFAGQAKQQLVFNTHGQVGARRLALIGLGACPPASSQLGAACWVRLGACAVRLANGVGAKHLALVLPEGNLGSDDRTAQLVRGLHLGGYAFDRYRSARRRPHSLKKVSLLAADAARLPASRRLVEAGIVAHSVALVRDLINQPANDLYPENFADLSANLAAEHRLKCSLMGPRELKKAGARLLLAVGQGSDRSPRLVHLRYAPTGAARRQAVPPVLLIGKGITFDSGGLSLKSPDKMYGMKMDMGGAATVLAVMVAVARLKLPIAVEGIMALAENMPSGGAIRPGDIVCSAAGKTIEINNTDAEGRLVLADALHLAGQRKPRCMVDFATLTGACMVALGNGTAGLFTNSDPLADQLLQASLHTGEDFWRLPLTPGLRDQLRSDVADMRNTGEPYGGAITAALFLQEFVGQTPWAHLDIAGPATSTADEGAFCKGGTGVAVASTVRFLQQLPATLPTSADEFAVD